MNYSSIEKTNIRPKWREKWKRPLLSLGHSTAVTIPKPILDCLGARPGKNVFIGWVYDMESGRDLLVIDFG